ncbi:peptide ABC transporter substrate-binding protein [Phenylobacterium sp.]|uniref:peptide ABC transporter substrate-binding protein n=1 Tax=Phenylobacterium sp. TaxID=1871053 RepID=UPI002720BBD4|nr:peptide ABC transporter substrate-binding protein [Phenylobacterium sp.]MDO8377876.1 peptide ABC transporter substrate-binding protein [Phenylobacterium sp.]
MNPTSLHPVLMAALGAAVLLLSACQARVSRPPCPAGEVCLAYGSNQEAGTLDPQTSNLVDEFTIIADLIFGLTTDAPDGAPIPAMATSWETSPDGLVWTFHLRDAKWSDGVAVTADDFVFAYRRILDPKTASIYAYLVYLLKNGQAVNEGKAPLVALGARAIDPRTLELTLEHPAPYLPELLKHQSFFPVPKHAVETWGDAWVKPGRYVSNGPFKLMSWKLGDHIEVVKNPNFYDVANVCVDRIDYFPTPDSVMAERRIQRGELDVNTSFQSNRIGRLRQTMPAYVRAKNSLATAYLSFNTREIAAFRDIRVRRALSEAVDREFITAKLLRAGQLPAYAFVPPGTAGYAQGPQTVWAHKPLAERQAEAKRLLAQAGYGPGHPLSFELKIGNSPDTILLASAVQADWASIGVDAKIVQNEGQIAFAAYRNRDFGVGAMSWFADFNDPVTFLGLMKSDTGGQNYGDYKNPAYDALLNQADNEPDARERADILQRAEQLMLADEAMIPVYFVVNRNLVSPKVTGWVDNVGNFHRARWLCVKK